MTMEQPVDDDELDRLITVADLDGLVRLVDARCATRDWAGVHRIRQRARSAIATGRQLWPAATLAEHRLALLATPEWASKVITEDSGRFAIGPLSEVVAQLHEWRELSSLVEDGPQRSFVAYERAIAGETFDVRDVFPVLDIPIEPAAWEPAYPRATYSDFGVECACPADTWPVDWRSPGESTTFEIVDDDWVTRALRDLVEPWTASSNGRAEAVIVAGTASDALHALGVPHARVSPLAPQQAMAWLGWCGASGGAHGRRRGAASGRFAAWWMAAAIGGAIDEWDELVEEDRLADEIGDIVTTTSWWEFDDGDRTAAYRLSLVAQLAHDPENDESATPFSVALLARDHPTLG